MEVGPLTCVITQSILEFRVHGATSAPYASLTPKRRMGFINPPHVYCQMVFINTLPFPALHLSRNAAIVSESLKICDQRMAK